MNVVAQAQHEAMQEIAKYGTPHPTHLLLAQQKGILLAKKLHADEEIVSLGTLLMDLKIGEAITDGKLAEHITMSAEAAGKLLDAWGFKGEKRIKVLNCIEAHHATVPFTCVEAEICANADCYRFLHPTGIMAAIALYGKRYSNFSETLDQLEHKMDEKHAILSLDVCKRELEPHYIAFKKMIAEARELSK